MISECDFLGPWVIAIRGRNGLGMADGTVMIKVRVMTRLTLTSSEAGNAATATAANTEVRRASFMIGCSCGWQDGSLRLPLPTAGS